jgi:hypothetical protein
MDSEPILRDAVDYLQATIVLGASDEWRGLLDDPCLHALLGGAIVRLKSYCSRTTPISRGCWSIPTAAAVGDCATHVFQDAREESSVCAVKICEFRQSRADSARLRAKHAREQGLALAAQPLPQSYAALMPEIHDEPWECCVCKEN